MYLFICLFIYIMKYPSSLSDSLVATPAFLGLVFSWYIFSVLLSLTYLHFYCKSLSCKQNIDEYV